MGSPPPPHTNNRKEFGGLNWEWQTKNTRPDKQSGKERGANEKRHHLERADDVPAESTRHRSLDDGAANPIHPYLDTTNINPFLLLFHCSLAHKLQ